VKVTVWLHPFLRIYCLFFTRTIAYSFTMVSGISNKCETKSKTPFPPFLLSVRPRPKTQEFHETILIPLLLLSYEPYSPLVAKKSSKAAHSSKPSPGFPMDIIFGILVSDGKRDPWFCADWRRNRSYFATWLRLTDGFLSSVSWMKR